MASCELHPRTRTNTLCMDSNMHRPSTPTWSSALAPHHQPRIGRENIPGFFGLQQLYSKTMHRQCTDSCLDKANTVSEVQYNIIGKNCLLDLFMFCLYGISMRRMSALLSATRSMMQSFSRRSKSIFFHSHQHENLEVFL